MDPIIRDVILQKITRISDRPVRVNDVIFHIPYLDEHDKFVLWKCYWPDCHNCCDRQGRLPLTSSNLITIGEGLKYNKTSDFIKNETLTATWQESDSIMTTINLKRKRDETAADDGTHISCRFLDGDGACTLHPGRPDVCYLYPFSTWLVNEGGRARIHASFQFTGDCPGFYLDESVEPMQKTLDEYSGIIYDYNMSSARTVREGFGQASI